MAAKRTVAKKAAPKKMGSTKTASKKNPTSIRVRMYRVGFGDFFLVTVPGSSGPEHILIDCGVTRGKTGKGDIATIKTAVRHMAAETDSKLALIIVTHRHQDHIIGFSRCAPEFSKFKVDAIWFPIWETEYESKVKTFQEDLEALAFSLGAAALAGDRDANTDEILGIVENATGISPKEGPGGGTNAKSLDLLKNKLGVKPEFLKAGDKPTVPAALSKAGLTARVLGPPPVDALDIMKLMDLKKGVGQFLAAVGGNRKQARLMPFGPEFVVPPSTYPSGAFREWAPRKRSSVQDFSKRHSKELERGVKAATPAALFMAAKKLDAMLNNQSLVVLFEWKGKKLLFAGDAQGGNWEYWLYGDITPATDPTGLTLSKDGKTILSEIDFYKVGHHGSTNATPIPAVEAMGKDFVSMCSTEDDTFGKPANNSEVPRVPLLDALRKKSAVVRSDQIAVSVGDLKVPATSDAKLPTPKKGKLEVGSCFVDYLV